MSSAGARAWLRMLAVCAWWSSSLDQAAKAAVDAVRWRSASATDLALGFQLTRVTNSGIAFGLLDDGGDALVLAFTLARPRR